MLCLFERQQQQRQQQQQQQHQQHQQHQQPPTTTTIATTTTTTTTTAIAIVVIHTVDGRNPAPVDVVDIQVCIPGGAGFLPSASHHPIPNITF